MSVSPSGSASAALDDAELLVLAGEFHGAPDLFDGLAEGIALYRCDGTIVHGNRASRRMVGRTPAELAGAHYSIHIAPHEVDRITRLHAQLIETEEPLSFETQFLHADGSFIDVAARLIPARSRGRLIGVLGIASDLTPFRNRERALQAERERFASFFEAHPDMVIMIAANGRIRLANRATEALTGFMAADLVGIPASRLLQPASVTAFDRALERALAGGSSDFAATANHKDGSALHLTMTSIPISVADVTEGMFCVCRAPARVLD